MPEVDHVANTNNSNQLRRSQAHPGAGAAKTFRPTRHSVGCTYQVQPDRLMRQALSISFQGKDAADRAELRATMSMSGVFDFHHFTRDDQDGTSNETQEESNDGGASPRKSMPKIRDQVLGSFTQNFGAPTVQITEDEADDEFYPKFRAVANLAAPSVVCTMAVFMKDIVNLYFVAQLGDLALMQAVGLGNIIVNTFIIGAGLSLNTSVENLVSQALGTGKLELCGHYLNRGILAWILAFFALCPLLIYSKAILLAIGIDLEIAMRSEQYLLCSIPGLF